MYLYNAWGGMDMQVQCIASRAYTLVQSQSVPSPPQWEQNMCTIMYHWRSVGNPGRVCELCYTTHIVTYNLSDISYEHEQSMNHKKAGLYTCTCFANQSPTAHDAFWPIPARPHQPCWGDPGDGDWYAHACVSAMCMYIAHLGQVHAHVHATMVTKGVL